MQVFKLCWKLRQKSSAIVDFVSISAFASLVCVLVEIWRSAVGINICAITVGIKKYKKKKEEEEKP